MFRDETLPEARVYEILANRRRRETIRHLTKHANGDAIPLSDLSKAIAAAEAEESPPPRTLRESVYNSLHQTHLPKLDDLGVVTYDRDGRTVRLHERARDVNLYMEVVTRYGLTWSEIYRTLAVGSLTLVVAALADVPIVAAIDPLLWATGALVVFIAATVVQLWSVRTLLFHSLTEP